jgi:hypothetical protein
MMDLAAKPATPPHGHPPRLIGTPMEKSDKDFRRFIMPFIVL